jgi:hypothetical protein
MPAIALNPAYAGPAIGSGIADRLRGAIRGGVILMAVAFTNAGAAIVTNRMIQAGTAPVNIGWGTGGATGAAVAQTALTTEAATSGGAAGGATTRTAGSQSRTTGTNANDQYTVTGTVTAAGTLAINEAGLFDAAQAGNMLIRSDFGVVNVASGDSIAFTFNLKFVPSAV